MKQSLLLSKFLILGIVSMSAACGETVNFETEEKPRVDASALPPSADGVNGGDVIQDPNSDGNGNGNGTDGDTDDDSTPPPITSERGEDGLLLACHGNSVIVKDEVLDFPEIPQGTTCKFGEGDNLSRVDGRIRAYLKQSQTVTIPDGAYLCGFDLEHDNASMRYDDEMFFSVNDRLLLATRDYTDYMRKNQEFYSFAWNDLVNKPYDTNDMRGVYCAGGSEGLASCSVPPTETAGQIKLSFQKEMEAALAKSLQDERSLAFDWVTTGDNDNSDCRHTAIKLKLKLRYVKP